VVAVNLPASNDSAGLTEYADAVINAVGERTQLILVAQSLAGFTAPLVCERLPVDLLVLLNAMVPAPGETPGDWWADTGHGEARSEQAAHDGRRLGRKPCREPIGIHARSSARAAGVVVLAHRVEERT
jgi:hypothetical protein